MDNDEISVGLFWIQRTPKERHLLIPRNRAMHRTMGCCTRWAHGVSVKRVYRKAESDELTEYGWHGATDQVEPCGLWQILRNLRATMRTSSS